MAAGRLEAEGVDCQVMEHAILHGITGRGASIAVEAEQFQRAVEVLSQTPARRCLLVKAVAIADGANVPAPGRARVRAVERILKWWTNRRRADERAAHAKARSAAG